MSGRLGLTRLAIVLWLYLWVIPGALAGMVVIGLSWWISGVWGSRPWVDLMAFSIVRVSSCSWLRSWLIG
jgi:hypothetical protein